MSTRIQRRHITTKRVQNRTHRKLKKLEVGAREKEYPDDERILYVYADDVIGVEVDVCAR